MIYYCDLLIICIFQWLMRLNIFNEFICFPYAFTGKESIQVLFSNWIFWFLTVEFGTFLTYFFSEFFANIFSHVCDLQIFSPIQSFYYSF